MSVAPTRTTRPSRPAPRASAPPRPQPRPFTPPAERLDHPLERLLDSPRALRVLGGAVPWLAHAVWRCVALAVDDVLP